MPQLDREVTIFGPGTGECVLIHFGNGKWFVIDSFINSVTKMPVALEYLNELGVSSTSVIGVLATHWHSDHIKGLDVILEHCQNATLYLTEALVKAEAEFYFHSLARGSSLVSKAFIQTIENIRAIISERNRTSRAISVKEQSLLYEDTAIRARLIALSPSQEAVEYELKSYQLPKPGDNRVAQGVPSSPNFNAVATYLEFDDTCSVLLGSDLEVTENDRTGWKAILTSGIEKRISLKKASLYKVAHHGSPTAHHQDIWNRLLISKPISATTCFSRSKLPSVQDQIRINDLSNSFYLTTNPSGTKPPKRENSVEKLLNANTKSRSLVRSPGYGRITFRWDKAGKLNITALPPAYLV